MAENFGKIVQVIGPTLDVSFDSDQLPAILNALRDATGLDLPRAPVRPIDLLVPSLEPEEAT